MRARKRCPELRADALAVSLRCVAFPFRVAAALLKAHAPRVWAEKVPCATRARSKPRAQRTMMMGFGGRGGRASAAYGTGFPCKRYTRAQAFTVEKRQSGSLLVSMMRLGKGVNPVANFSIDVFGRKLADAMIKRILFVSALRPRVRYIDIKYIYLWISTEHLKWNV